MPDSGPILGRPFEPHTMRSPLVVDALLAEPTRGYALNERGWFERGVYTGDPDTPSDYERLDAEQLRDQLGISTLEWEAWIRWKQAPVKPGKRGRI